MKHLMLRLLAVLLFLCAALRCVNGALAKPVPVGLVIAVFILLGTIFALAYFSIRDGGKVARFLLSAYAAYQVVISFLIVASGRSVSMAARIAEALVCVAIIVVLNTPPISTLRRPIVQAKARPTADDHEHNWQQHDLLNDWIRCRNCGVMHAEPGTIALINQRKT